MHIDVLVISSKFEPVFIGQIQGAAPGTWAQCTIPARMQSQSRKRETVAARKTAGHGEEGDAPQPRPRPPSDPPSPS